MVLVLHARRRARGGSSHRPNKAHTQVCALFVDTIKNAWFNQFVHTGTSIVSKKYSLQITQQRKSQSAERTEDSEQEGSTKKVPSLKRLALWRQIQPWQTV